MNYRTNIFTRKRIYCRFHEGLQSLFEVTNSMEHSRSSEANSHLACQEITSLLCNPEVHYRGNKSPTLVHILNEINPVCTFPTYFFKIYFNIISASMPRTSAWSHPFRLSVPSPSCVLHVSHMSFSSI